MSKLPFAIVKGGTPRPIDRYADRLRRITQDKKPVITVVKEEHHVIRQIDRPRFISTRLDGR